MKSWQSCSTGRRRLDRLDDAALSAYYHFLLARTHLFVGDRERTIESAERAIADSARCGDTTTRGKAHYVLAQEAPLSGPRRRGHPARARVARLPRAHGRRAWWIGQAHWVVGLNHAQLGELDAALEAETRARIIGETGRRPPAPGLGALRHGIVHAALGQAEAGIEACRAESRGRPRPADARRRARLARIRVRRARRRRAGHPGPGGVGPAARRVPLPAVPGLVHGVPGRRLPPRRPARAGARAPRGRRSRSPAPPARPTASGMALRALGRVQLAVGAPGRGHGDAPRGRGGVRGDAGALRRGARLDGPRGEPPSRPATGRRSRALGAARPAVRRAPRPARAERAEASPGRSPRRLTLGARAYRSSASLARRRPRRPRSPGLGARPATGWRPCVECGGDPARGGLQGLRRPGAVPRGHVAAQRARAHRARRPERHRQDHALPDPRRAGAARHRPREPGPRDDGRLPAPGGGGGGPRLGPGRGAVRVPGGLGDRAPAGGAWPRGSTRPPTRR